MKKCKEYFLLIFLFISVSCEAQIMSTPGDVQKLKDQETKFIGKPLKKLLKEIGPEIKTVFGQSHLPDGQASLIVFKFVDAEKYFKKEKGKSYATIFVFIKENFDWDSDRSVASRRYTWTKDDEKKYGSLTVVAIRVISAPE